VLFVINSKMDCDCNVKKPRLKVHTNNRIYNIEFGQVQIEITGRCNMNCEHCRASGQLKEDMPINQIIKIIKFARQFSPDYKEIIVSGGEPLLHKNFNEVLKAIRENGGEFITLTTNGSLLKKEHLDFIKKLKFKRVVLSVSLDSLNPKEHNDFRNNKNAFEKAIKAIRLILDNKDETMIASIRSTIKPCQIKEMEKMTNFAKEIGCDRISFSAIHPAGKAIERSDLWMTREQKKEFIKEIYRLKEKFPKLNVTTNDPLKCLLRKYNDIGEKDELVFDGCGAGVITFNVDSSGFMTPCALLDIKMMNVFPLTIEEITEKYKNNEIVKNMLCMNLKGKCGKCDKKYQCGGCRARAHIQNKDYLGEDPHCWKE